VPCAEPAALRRSEAGNIKIDRLRPQAAQDRHGLCGGPEPEDVDDPTVRVEGGIRIRSDQPLGTNARSPGRRDKCPLII
jgi:hypothetical protein